MEMPSAKWAAEGAVKGICRVFCDVGHTSVAGNMEVFRKVHGSYRESKGFVYCVSSLGVTGMRSQITTDIRSMVKLVKEVQDIPCAVGFGISTPAQAKNMAAQSDGAIVGSAIVKLCGRYGADCVPYIKEYVKSMKEAVLQA